MNIQGHIEKVEVGGPTGLTATLQFDTALCRDPVVLFIPKKDATLWIPGTTVTANLSHPSGGTDGQDGN